MWLAVAFNVGLLGFFKIEAVATTGPDGFRIAEAILIPLGLNRLKIDPAVASSVFVTTVTDVVGFFGFLGLASLWLRLFGTLP